MKELLAARRLMDTHPSWRHFSAVTSIYAHVVLFMFADFLLSVAKDTSHHWKDGLRSTTVRCNMKWVWSSGDEEVLEELAVGLLFSASRRPLYTHGLNKEMKINYISSDTSYGDILI
jgi:hypothetical protein